VGRCASAEARSRAFLVGWTRKEACLKAVGAGLLLDTRTFEAGLAAAGCGDDMRGDGLAASERVVPVPWEGTIHRLRLQSIALSFDAVASVAALDCGRTLCVVLHEG